MPNNCEMERKLQNVCKAVQDPKSKGVTKVPIRKPKQPYYKQTNI